MKITKQQRPLIIKAYKLGKKTSELAKIYNVSAATIYSIVTTAERLESGKKVKEIPEPLKSISDISTPDSFKNKSQTLRDENRELKIMYAELALEYWRQNSVDRTLLKADWNKTILDKSPS